MAAGGLLATLGVHGVVLPASLVGLYRYGDRTESFKKSVDDVDDLLTRMRGHVTAALEDELGLVLERSDGEPKLVRPDGYSERATNPVGSEYFREALGRFMNANVEVVVDYGRTSRARGAWCFWARTLSWVTLGLAIWEALCVATLGVIGELWGIPISSGVAKWSFVPTILLIAAFFVCQIAMLRHHDVIHDSKERYHDF